VTNRFELMGVPSWGLVDLLVFWGGQQSGFSGFEHEPIEYAKEVNIPTLIIYGAHDPKVKLWEVQEIHQNLAAEQKELLIIPDAGHNHMLRSNKELWGRKVTSFIKAVMED